MESRAHAALTRSAGFGKDDLRSLLHALLAFMLVSSAIGAPRVIANDDIHGLWIEGDKRKVAVLIEDCDDKLCGHIFWLKKPLSDSGRPKQDSNNPDAAMRERPLCGLRLLNDFRRVNDNTWNAGKIYNPSDGGTFKGIISLKNDGTLKIRGYIGISFFGKTVKWVRPQKNMERCS